MTTRAVLINNVTYLDDGPSDEKVASIRSKFRKNYFGLPPFGSEMTPAALTYMCRKTVEDIKTDGDQDDGGAVGSLSNPVYDDEYDSRLLALSDEVNDSIDSGMYVAQRKVASALLTMVNNELMVKHFLYKGGLDAVLKLLHESKDSRVLFTCTEALLQASSDPKDCETLIKKGILNTLNSLNSHTDPNITSRVFVDEVEMKHLAASIIGNLTVNPDLDEPLVKGGLLAIVQNVSLQVSKMETICQLMMSISNMCPVVSGPDAEVAIRLCLQLTKKIDISKHQSVAIFIADVFNNFSRINHYSALLVDEGVIPLLLHMMDMYMVDDMLRLCTEAMANLSINRKNRRELSGSGIASRLTNLFDSGSPITRGYSLMIMGNLLSSGLFYDKVANEHTISYILSNLLDPRHAQQFNAVCYCLCQLAKVHASCEVMVNTGVIPILLGFLRKAPKLSLDNLWSVLVSISKHQSFFPQLMTEVESLMAELYEMVKDDDDSVFQRQCVVQIALNVSRRPELSEYLSIALVETFVVTLKLLFSAKNATSKIRLNTMKAMINFAFYCKPSRQIILGSDLIDMMQDAGIQDDKLNVKYVGLINIISNEDNCIYKLLDLGSQRLLVSLQDSFNRLELLHTQKEINVVVKKDFKKGEGTKLLAEMMNDDSFRTSSSIADDDKKQSTAHSSRTADEKEEKSTAAKSKKSQSRKSFKDYSEGEMGKALSAATLHNLALKRPTLVPGVLQMLLNLAKNNFSLRVLHCVRSLSNMTIHPKAKVALNKEARRIIPLLTAIMRCGCEEAEKVQYYCAVALCNIFAGNIDNGSLMEMIKSTTVVDLVVVTLLRINATQTKEILCKVFFNMLARVNIRNVLVVQQDLLASIIELCKVEFIELFELCVRILYNITCELSPSSQFFEDYSKKLIQLKLTHFMIDRLLYKPGYEKQGSATNKAIRILMGMSLANMSFNKPLATDMTHSGKTISEAMARVLAIHSEETTYCALVTYYNLSFIPECVVLTGTPALEQIVNVVTRESSVITFQLCVAFICNVSNMEQFQEELAQPSIIKAIIHVISAPQLSWSIKMDAVQAVYNCVSMYPPCREAFIENDIITALWKILKAQGIAGATNDADASTVASSSASVATASTVGTDASQASLAQDQENSVVILIGSIVEELCNNLLDPRIHKKAMADGVMNVILKLAKIELPSLKLSVSICMYNMIKSGDTMRVLKWDSVDILFWLTLHDTLSLHDSILRNVARTLRSFSSDKEESKVLVRQERFFAVFKELIKSKNEDVLWQAAGVLYNLMQHDFNISVLLDKGLIGFIFDIAASGFENVRHVCSACLHLVPNNMPNMDDPVVLELVLCLLEAQGDKFAQLSDKPTDVVPRNSVDKLFSGTKLKHTTTNFKAVWTPVTTGLETVWSPAMLYLAEEDATSDLTTEQTVGVAVASDGNVLSPHQKITSKQYSGFHRESLSSASEEARKAKASDPCSDLLQLSIPELTARAPLHMRSSGDEADRLGRGKEKARNQTLPTLPSKTNSRPQTLLLQPPKEIPKDTVGAIGGSLFGRTPKPDTNVYTVAKGLPIAVLKSNPGRATVSINQHSNRDT